MCFPPAFVTAFIPLLPCFVIIVFNLKPVSSFSSCFLLPPCLSALTYPWLLLSSLSHFEILPFFSSASFFFFFTSHFPPQPIRQITKVPWTAPPGARQRAALPPVGHIRLCTQDLDENNCFTYDTRQETSTSSYICE